MERLNTGLDELDLILGGGVPSGSLVVLAGGPGTGKTILAQQISFAKATPERKGIYYTTMSEPHDKLVRHLEPFDFFDSGALGDRVEFVHLGDLMPGAAESSGDLGAVVTEIVQRCLETKPAVIVIDSIKALHDVVEPQPLRKAIYDLASRVAHTGVVLLFVGEYTPDEIERLPEFALADGILQLAYEPHEPLDRRWLRVVKMRGSSPLAGKHSFRIGRAGLEVFPRLESIVVKREQPVADGRISSGMPELDALLGGGLPVADATAVLGPTGSGKTAIALRFVVEGVRADECCLYISFQETADQLVRKADSFGWDLTSGLDSGLLRIHHVPQGELNLDLIGAVVQKELASRSTRRVALDSLGELVVAARETERFPAYARMLSGLVRASGASLMVTSETNVMGPILEPLGGLSFLFHNVVLLRYVELESEMRRALNVLKMRDSSHAKGLVQFDIDEHGPRIVGKLEGLTGVLGWTALYAERPVQ